jgi:hypothetical protein
MRWEREPEAGTASGPIGGSYRAAVRGDDRLADRKTDAHSLVLGREETLEHPAQVALGHPWPVVSDGQRDGATFVEVRSKLD